METNPTMRCGKWVLLPGFWLGACSDTVNSLGRVEVTGGAISLSGTGGGPTAGSAGSGASPGSAGTAGSGGATACPAGLPASSAACSPDGLGCSYDGCSTGAGYCGAIASCVNGRWSIGYTNCVCASSGGSSSAGGSGGTAGAGGAGGASCSRYLTDDAHCSTMGYPPHAYFCVVPVPMPDPTCVIYNGIDSGDFFCCP